MATEQDYIQSNRHLWDRWTDIHVESEFYDMDGFRRGRNTLDPIEVAELTEVAGKSLLHLQCHFGQNTLSWARLGASVTGADFSPRAIEYARTLAAEIGIDNARFVCADLYDLPDALHERFDIVYTGGGVLSWLPDLARWGQVVSRSLKPGGTFYIREFHPVAQMLDENDSALTVKFPYFHSMEPLLFETQGSYAEPGTDVRSVEHCWIHSLGDVVNALTLNGLRVEWMHEFDECGYKMLALMEQGENGQWRLPAGKPSLPLTFSIRATKE